MEAILSLLTILTIFHFGSTGDKEPEQRCWTVQKPCDSSSIKNRNILDVYHETDPLTRGHEKRIGEKVKDMDPRCLRQCAIYWIQKMCADWPRMTGLDIEETHNLLRRIYEITKTNEPDQERRMREKLLEIRPDLRKIDPEYIRSLVHDWYKSTSRAMIEATKIRSRKDQADLLYTYYQTQFGEGIIQDRLGKKWEQFHPELGNQTRNSLSRKANELSKVDPRFSAEELEEARKRYEKVFGIGSGIAFRMKLPKRTIANDVKRIRLREDQADLVYTYYRVRTGEGDISDRIAEKWKEFHPNLSNYSKFTLIKKASELSRAKPAFTPGEMRAAKRRYESVFGPGVELRGRLKWNEVQMVDLLYLFQKYKQMEISGTEFDFRWKVMHPEFSFTKRKVLSNKVDSLKRKQFILTPEKEAEAETRMKAALARNKQSNLSTSDFGHDTHERRLLKIREGKEPSQQYQDIPSSPDSPHINLDLTLGRSSWHPTMDESGPSHTKSYYHSHADYQYGSSSHSQSDQVPLELQRDVPDQHRHQWDHGASSSSSPDYR